MPYVQQGASQLEQTMSEKEGLREPPRYKVIINNDDFTPMDFVVALLEKFFQMDSAKATQVMLTIHHQGEAVCGIYPAEIAETKAMLINDYVRQHKQILLCTIEPE